MRSLSNACTSWNILERFDSLEDLRKAIRGRHYDGSGDNLKQRSEGLRSVCWKACLLHDNLELGSWPRQLDSQRRQYETYRDRYLSGPREDETDSFSDPLSDAPESSWTDARKDDTLKEEILQDVDRCMPENLYFRQPATRNMLLDILFVWSKLNADVSYRQGMHEILAPLVWAVERDAIDPSSIKTTTSEEPLHATMRATLDASFIEHDSFALFEALMVSLKGAYAARSSKGNGHKYSNSIGSLPEIVSRSQHIMHDLLALADLELGAHLQSLEIPPQLFLMRWIRLLFGREFPFDQCMELWDALFAEKASSPIVDLVCVAMILRIRWQLLKADHNTALGLLLHYPQLSANEHATSLLNDAKLLQSNINFETGKFIIHKHTGRAPKPPEQEAEFESISLGPKRQDPNTRTAAATGLTVPRANHQPSNSFEAVLQNAAKSVYSSSERLGVNKAVRDAVGDVRRNVQTIRHDMRARSHSRNVSTASTFTESHEDSIDLQRRLTDNYNRNKSLAKMLDEAVSELWKQQKEMTSDEARNETARGSEVLKAFTMAIAKVQLAQVYLDDPDLPLPDDELQTTTSQARDNSTTSKKDERQAPAMSISANVVSDIPDNLARSPPQASPGAEVDSLQFMPPTKLTEKEREIRPDHTATDREAMFSQTKESQGSCAKASLSHSTTAKPATSSQDQQRPTNSKPTEGAPARPSLEQSPFSWMLGQDDKPSSQRSSLDRGVFDSTKSSRPGPRRNKDNQKSNFLFGEPEDG